MQLPLTEASADLARLVEATLRGEEIIILKDNQPIVKLTRIEKVSLQPSPSSQNPVSQSADLTIKSYPLREMPLVIAENFDEPMPEFWEALAE